MNYIIILWSFTTGMVKLVAILRVGMVPLNLNGEFYIAV